MSRFNLVIACCLATSWATTTTADEIKFAGQITSYGHGEAGPEDYTLPAPYTGSFTWNSTLKTASFVITAPSLDAGLLTDPSIKTRRPLTLRKSYKSSLRPQDRIVKTAEGLAAELSAGEFSSGQLIEFFNLDASLVDGTGQWSFSQDIPVALWGGFNGLSGSITSIVGVVPEPSSLAIAMAFCTLAGTTPRR